MKPLPVGKLDDNNTCFDLWLTLDERYSRTLYKQRGKNYHGCSCTVQLPHENECNCASVQVCKLDRAKKKACIHNKP